MKIIVDGKECDGCRICEQICTFFHEQEFNPRRARIKVEKVELQENTPILCNQCRDCLDVCPLEAISWDEALGIVRIDGDQCNGCGICIDSCELGALYMDPVTELAITCDLCNGDPQCVKWCPEEGVLRYEPQGVAKV